MTTPNVSEPVAIPTAAQAATQYAADTFDTVTGGKNAPPPAPSSGVNVSDDVALGMFHRIAAERRTRAAEGPLEVPFGSGTIRIHKTMPASFVFDAQEAENDPTAAKRMLRDAIVPDDHAKFDSILYQPPSNPEGVDGMFLLGFLEALGRLYTGVPLGGQ